MSLSCWKRVSRNGTTKLVTSNSYRDGNIRYFEYENDKFEFLSEYKSGDPQRGLAFVPRRGINVGQILASRILILTYHRFMRMK
jgi:hypothetical protein